MSMPKQSASYNVDDIEKHIKMMTEIANDINVKFYSKSIKKMIRSKNDLRRLSYKKSLEFYLKYQGL